jgi:hypothetical protein
MKISGDIVFVIVLFASLIVIMVFVLPRLPQEGTAPNAPYSTYSEYPNGVNALYRLLLELDFPVERIRANPYTLPDALAVLFLLQSSAPVAEEARKAIHSFVERGGILLVAGTRNLDPLLQEYGLRMVQAKKPLHTAQRLLAEPLANKIIAKTEYAISPINRAVVPLFGDDTDYVIVTFRVGRGRIFVFSCPYIFTRKGLEQEENAKLLYNLITYFPPQSRIGFDEYHHGFREPTATQTDREANVLIRTFLRTPMGWAFVYAGGIIFLFLLLHGRRLGQLLETIKRSRRLAAEYVLAMANLYQKSGNRSAILSHIRNEFRRSLAARWHLNPTVDTRTFAGALVKCKPINADLLLPLLQDLDQTGSLSEGRLLNIAQRVEAYKQSMERS